MPSLRIDICNERLLPRFGVDRLLVLLGNHLRAQGHHIGFVCLRCDAPMLERISSDITVVDVPGGSTMAQNEQIAREALDRRWQRAPADVMVCGGWPFYSTAAGAARHGVRSFYIDAGAVAQDGIPDELLPVHHELRRIRRLTMPFFDRIAPISNFVRFSQTEPDRGSSTGIRTVLLGADHMALGQFRGTLGPEAVDTLLPRLDALGRDGARFLLCLGRFESRGYKNSPAAYDLLRTINRQMPDVHLLLLDAGQDCNVPPNLASRVILLGIPDDRTLQEIMRRCEIGISTSLWEGFNLPIAEMQWLERPALALNLGAHPEVAADPWLLCSGIEEMAAKALALLSTAGPDHLPAAFADFRKRYRWQRTLDAWETEITALAGDRSDPERPLKYDKRRIVIVDVTHAALDPANPGVIRVTRRLSAELQQDPELELVFASWSGDARRYVFLDATRQSYLERYGGPADGLGTLALRNPDVGDVAQVIEALVMGRERPPVLFLPEVIIDGQIAERIEWAHSHGCRIAALLHDLIPFDHPEFCADEFVALFPAYLKGLAKLDAVWSVSRHTEHCFLRFLENTNLPVPAVHGAVWLPGQFAGWPRGNAPSPGIDEIRILCVSTLEPRKNHLRVLEAFQMLLARRPDLSLKLVLVGNRYSGAPEIANQIQAAAERDNRIIWLGVISDEQLAQEFQRALFSVYPSLTEGFGLPILESLWMSRPCISHNAGVMQELASAGGCLAIDMADTRAIAGAMEQLASDGRLRQRLSNEAAARPIATWNDYAGSIAHALRQL